MPIQFGLGPVFKYEWLATTRRWQLYAVRSLFVAAILVGLIIVWISRRHQGPYVPLRELANLGRSLYFAIVWIQMTVVLFAAPAATAGAICLDKARGTLDHVLATQLSDAEIVLGKLCVRLIPVVGLIGCVLPVMVLGSLLGGIDPDSLFGSFAVTLGVASLSCTLAFAISIWGRRTHEVLLATYLVLILWVLGPVLICVIMEEFGGRGSARWTWDKLSLSNPYYLITAPYSEPGKIGYGTWLGFLGICSTLSAGLATLATLKVRSVSLSQAGLSEAKPERKLARRTGRWSSWNPRLPSLPSPSLDGNPILWREWHRNRPSRWMRVIWSIYSILALVLTILGIQDGGVPNRGLAEGSCAVIVNVGLILLSVQAATSLAEERMRGSLDILLATPLSTFEILAGKWLGIYRIVPRLMCLPALITFTMSFESGRWFAWLQFIGLTFAYAAAVTSVGLALATWISRLGRAIAGSVAAYIAFNASIIAVLAYFEMARRVNIAVFFSIGGSLYGTIFGAVNVGSIRQLPGNQQEWVSVWILVWGTIHVLLAMGLFATTWATFDRCLGRSSTFRGPSHDSANADPARPKGQLQAGLP